MPFTNGGAQEQIPVARALRREGYESGQCCTIVLEEKSIGSVFGWPRIEIVFFVICLNAERCRQLSVISDFRPRNCGIIKKSCSRFLHVPRERNGKAPMILDGAIHPLGETFQGRVVISSSSDCPLEALHYPSVQVGRAPKPSTTLINLSNLWTRGLQSSA